jgi:hypothetical protein
MEYVDGRLFEELEIAQWGGIPAPAVSPINTSRIYYDETLDYMLLSENGGPYSRLLNILAAAGTFLKLDCSNDPLTGDLDLNTKKLYLRTGSTYLWDGGVPNGFEVLANGYWFTDPDPLSTFINLTFTSNGSTGYIYWWGASHYFKFNDDIMMELSQDIYFRDTALSIGSDNDGYLDLKADTGIRLNEWTAQTGAGVQYFTVASTDHLIAGIRFQRSVWETDAFTDYQIYNNSAGDLYIDKLISSVTTAILQYDEDINRFNLFTNLNIGSAGAGIDPVLTFDGDTDNAVITYDVSDNELDFGDTNTLTIGQMKAGNAGGSNAFVVKSGSKLVFDGA